MRGRRREYAPEKADPTIDAPLGFTARGVPISKGLPKEIILAGADDGRALGPDGFEVTRRVEEGEDEFKIRALQEAARSGFAWLSFRKPLHFQDAHCDHSQSGENHA